MYKYILMSLFFVFSCVAHADSEEWIPIGKNQWLLKIEGVGGEADVHVKITPHKKVIFHVSRPCPDMEPKRVDTLSWEAGSTWGTGLDCNKKPVRLSTPPLWEKLVGLPKKAQKLLDTKYV